MKTIKMKLSLYLTLTFIIGLSIGLSLGIILTLTIITESVEDAVSNLRIENIEVGFNESYIMDRFEIIINETVENQEMLK